MAKVSSRALNSCDKLERERALKQVRTLEVRERVAALSPREQQVLCSLAAGHQSKTTADQLGISVRTTEVHRTPT